MLCCDCAFSLHGSIEDLYFLDVPVRDMNDPTKKRTEMMRVPMILPHELLQYLTDSCLSVRRFKGNQKFPDSHGFYFLNSGDGQNSLQAKRPGHLLGAFSELHG